ncbi:MAG: hypothetical protein AB8G99_01885 [Planctomycetaceae bacterium]
MRESKLKRNKGETWLAYFRRVEKPPTGAIRNTVLELHNDKKYVEVTTLIEAALLRGMSEPWMYDVLALTMKLTNRPQEDIDRALLSRVDFDATQVPSMMYSAAYLRRLGANEPALKLYQQAARLAPARPEPYVLGMRIAKSQKQWETVGWGAAGVISYAWTKDQPKLHAEAEGAAGDAYKALLKEGRKVAAGKLKSQMAEARKRDLMVKLKWSGEGDLDLLVEEPGGAVCSYKEPQTNGGGFLIHEGSGPNQKNCYEEYVCPVAVPGQYKLRVRFVYGEIVGKRASLEVTRYKGTDRESSVTLPVRLESDDAVVTVPLPNGRATKKRKK